MADISKIKLPSGNEYDIKDAVARQMISGGVSFNIVWTQADYASSTAPTADKLATIPEGITVAYNNGEDFAVGTLVADGDSSSTGYTPGFYLVYSRTQLESMDKFDEYVTVTSGNSYAWEKIGDTQVDLSSVVTDVRLNKQILPVIGSQATFSVTQPDIALSTDSTSGSGKVQVATGITSANASGGSVSWNSKDQVTVLTGVKVTSQPDVTLTANDSTGTGRLKYVEDVTGGSVSPTKVHLSATANNGSVSASGDNVTAITGLGTPSTSSVVGGLSTAKLATTTVTGVSGSTNITPVESRSSQTTVSGFTASTTSNYDSTNDILKGASVTNEMLVFGAYKPSTQTTYSAGAPRASLAVPTAAASATTVATGSTTTSGSGATVATGSSGTVSAVTGYASPTTDTVLGTASTFNVTNPSITISTSGNTGPEVVSNVNDITVSPTYKYMSGSASGTAVGANGTDTVIGTDSTFTVTQPTITVTPSTTYIKGSASGANTTWDNKNIVEALTKNTTLDITRGKPVDPIGIRSVSISPIIDEGISSLFPFYWTTVENGQLVHEDELVYSILSSQIQQTDYAITVTPTPNASAVNPLTGTVGGKGVPVTFTIPYTDVSQIDIIVTTSSSIDMEHPDFDNIYTLMLNLTESV